MHSLFFCSTHPLNLTPERDGAGARETGRRKIHIHPIYQETGCLLNEILQNKLTSKLCPKKHQHEQFKHCQFSMFCFTIFTLVKSSNMWHLPCLKGKMEKISSISLQNKRRQQNEYSPSVFTTSLQYLKIVNLKKKQQVKTLLQGNSRRSRFQPLKAEASFL